MVAHAAPATSWVHDLASRHCHVFLESRPNRTALTFSRITLTFSRIGQSHSHSLTWRPPKFLVPKIPGTSPYRCSDYVNYAPKYVGRQHYSVHDNGCPISVQLAGSAVELASYGLGSRSQRSWHRQNNIAQRGIVSCQLRHRSSENPG